MLALAFLITSILTTTSTLKTQTWITPPMAQEIITPLITKDLAGFFGEQALMNTVGLPSGFSSPVNRHNGQVFVYVLVGSVVMQVRGQKELTLGPGQSFTKIPTLFTPLAGTQVVQNQQNSLCSLFTNKGLRWCYEESNQRRPLEDRKEESAC